MAKKNNTIINKKYRVIKKDDQMRRINGSDKLWHTTPSDLKSILHNKVTPVLSGTGVEPPFMELKKSKKIKK